MQSSDATTYVTDATTIYAGKHPVNAVNDIAYFQVTEIYTKGQTESNFSIIETCTLTMLATMNYGTDCLSSDMFFTGIT